MVARERHISAQGKEGLLVNETSEFQLFPSSKKKDVVLLISTFQRREREREKETMPAREEKGAGEIDLF